MNSSKTERHSETAIGRRKALMMLALLGVVVFLGACASTPNGSAEDEVTAEAETYYGVGRGETLGTAMNSAKIDAVRNAVIDLIGEEAERRHEATLEEVLYSTRNPNRYVYNETMERLRSENLGTIDDMEMLFELRIRVDIPAVQSVLDAHRIGARGGSAGDESGAHTADDAPATGTNGVTERAVADGEVEVAARADRSEAWDEATPEQQRFINRYIDTMTYMVYFNQDSEVDEFLQQNAIAQANRYLAGNDFIAVDSAQVERLRREQEYVYEAETGREIGMLQWIAQRLNADVYIEIDLETSHDSRADSHYGTAHVTMRIFETSTGQLLGAVTRQSPRTFSRSGAREAVLNAVQSTVYQAMPVVVEQSERQMQGYLARGVRYELVIQNTLDARMMSEFRRRLRAEVSDLITVSQTADETRYTVFYFGRVDDLEDLLYETSEIVPGLQNMYHVITRGNSMTFDTGL